MKGFLDSPTLAVSQCGLHSSLRFWPDTRQHSAPPVWLPFWHDLDRLGRLDHGWTFLLGGLRFIRPVRTKDRPPIMHRNPLWTHAIGVIVANDQQHILFEAREADLAVQNSRVVAFSIRGDLFFGKARGNFFGPYRFAQQAISGAIILPKAKLFADGYDFQLEAAPPKLCNLGSRVCRTGFRDLGDFCDEKATCVRGCASSV